MRNFLHLFLLLGSLFGAMAPAATITVTNTNDSGAGSLRQALQTARDSATEADTIVFDASLNGQTITLAEYLGTADDVGVTVDATGLSNGLTLLQGAANKRGFFNNGVLTLRGIKITGAKAPLGEGGGAVLSAGTLTLDRCTFSGNSP